MAVQSNKIKLVLWICKYCELYEVSFLKEIAALALGIRNFLLNYSWL